MGPSPISSRNAFSSQRVGVKTPASFATFSAWAFSSGFSFDLGKVMPMRG